MSKIKLVTHNGSFHLDDLLAVSLVKLLHPDTEVEIKRTRDKSIIASADWVVDVGGVYDHDNRRYDHHQINSPVRVNNVPYAAFGLLWRHWGSELCGDQSTADLIDQDFVQMLDGPDNGYPTFQSLIKGASVPSLAMLASIWQPNWDDDYKEYDEAFIDLQKTVQLVLVKLINTYISRQRSYELFAKIYRQAGNKQLIEVPTGVRPDSSSSYPDLKFIISEDVENKTWKARCVTDEGFDCRLSFPTVWRGQNTQKLVELSRIPTAIFVHPAGFLAIASSREGIYEMCNHVLKN